MKLKETLALPRTDFPMKASLPQREPERLKRWADADLHGRLRQARKGARRYVLHDGPPYANGHVHLGTALNKILKDFILKSRSQMGFDVPYVPGWDCHGMPIEHAVLRELKGTPAPPSSEIRRRCREFAESFVEVQRAEFKRLGILGDWEHPYLTMNPSYQATVVASFGRLWRAGHVYRGLRSIHWCPTCQTALANAEIEHDENHRSTAIHVRFPVEANARAAALGLPGDAAFLAWTTTPWTIPANVALAVHPDLEYVLVGGDASHAIVARALLPAVSAAVGWKEALVERSWKGSELVGAVARHPLFERPSPIVPADYVTVDAGTGVVHTAPGHGADDFETGRKHGLPILVPVGKDGRFDDEAGPYVGRHVFEANGAIVDDLAARGALVHRSTYVHSYPTCWRCHGDIIFLATEQWFWGVDHQDVRRRALEAVDATRWVPPWGHDRMHDSVSVRPDWCLSRQRAWGVPIPALACACGAPVVSDALLQRAEAIVREGGADAWLAADMKTLAAGETCGACGGSDLSRDPSILDVWFDSACSHLAVLDGARSAELAWPADLYLEAVDQHRGWFQVSLLTGVALKGAPPYRAVYTHGLILDENGRKMSKSLGNAVSPEEILEKHGADVLRLFFASVDATSDIRFSRGLVEPVGEAYRKIRNTLRFLLSNLADFDPGRDAVPEDRLPELDRYFLDCLRRTSREARGAWDEMEIHRVQRLLHGYLSGDVSAFHAHVLKDRLYCDLPSGSKRRAAQQVLFEIARECCQLLAPILCFTADEAWEKLPAWPGKPDSVHLDAWRELPTQDDALASAWEDVIAVRADVLKALEVARAAGLIGDPLEAAVVVALPDARRSVVASRTDALAEACVVSSLTLAAPAAPAPEGAHAIDGGWVLVARATGAKCPRCWAFREDAAGIPGHPDCCRRCSDVVIALGVAVDPA